MWFVNDNGFSTMRHRSTGGEIQEVTGLPPGVAATEFGFFGLAPRLDGTGRNALVLLGRPGAPAQLWRVALPAGTAEPVGPVRRPVIGLPEVVRFGTAPVVSGLLYRPPGEGPHPAVLVVHGGPEVQALPASDRLIDRLVTGGIAVLASNIRGSSGFGLRFQRLVYRDWGGGDVEDLRAAAEFLTTVPWIDADRLAVYGASYGGFAALSCLTRLPEYWRAGAAECAIADLEADVRAFPPTWRRRARDWVGDPDDPADRARFASGSPLSFVDAVRAPVLLVHGTNDTRADIGPVDAFHAELVRLGKPVEYHRILDAGHELDQGVDSKASSATGWPSGCAIGQAFGKILDECRRRPVHSTLDSLVGEVTWGDRHAPEIVVRHRCRRRGGHARLARAGRWSRARQRAVPRPDRRAWRQLRPVHLGAAAADRLAGLAHHDPRRRADRARTVTPTRRTSGPTRTTAR